jgi:acyl-coenzyme A synthetase/AMP-(fatty) acid ligase
MSRLQALAAKALERDRDEPGIQFEGRWRTWGEFADTAREVVRLVEESGAPDRAPVLLIARNIPATLSALTGLIAAGRNIRMLYSFQAPAAMAREVGRLKPGVVIAAEPEFSDEVLDAVRMQGAAAIALGPLQACAVAGLERSTAELDPSAPAQPTIEIQTSGTTGPPKHFPVTYEQAMLHFIDGSPMAAGMIDAAMPSLFYSPLPNFAGMYGGLPLLLLGMKIILHDRFDLSAWREYVRTYRPAVMGLQPAALQMLMDADAPAEELSSLRYMAAGSAPLNPDTQLAFEQKYGIPVLYAYGATEFLGTVCSWTPELRERWGNEKLGSVGPPLKGLSIRTVDPETFEVQPPNREGVLEVLHPQMQPDWIRTSDIGLIDEDGFLYLRGRADGAIVRGGFKIVPEIIERALLKHEAVRAASVVGVPDRRLGQTPGAAIELRAGASRPSPAELEQHLRQNVLATYVPAHWRFVDELPRTQSLKVDRRAVAALFE